MFNLFKKKEKVEVKKYKKYYKISVLFKDGDEVELVGDIENTYISTTYPPFTIINLKDKRVFYKSEDIQVITQELIKEEIDE